MTTFEERIEAGNARAWRPDQDDPDLLVGIVREIDSGTSDYQGSYPIITVEKEDGELVAVHAFHTVIRNELLRQRPNIGERIGIKFLGEQKAKPGSPYGSFIGYRVKVDREAAAFNWGKFGGEDPDPVAEEEPAQDPVDAAAAATAGEDDIPF